MSKLILIDGNNIIHRAYYAIPSNLTTTSGEPINAIYGFVSMLLRIIEDLEPTHLAICFDREEPTFRKKEFEDYQSQRAPTDPELKSQFDKSRDVAKAFGIPSFEKTGFEADDLIGTLAFQVTNKHQKIGKRTTIDEVVIVTTDKDMMQLVDDKRRIRINSPVRGLSNTKTYKEEDVVGKLGVRPDRVIDLKAFMGDNSDNYPGVFGIGPKTASNLLEKYDTYENVYKHIDDIPKSTAKKLIEGKEGGDISYKLARIVTDVDFKFDIEQMAKWKVDSEKVIRLFDKYGFRTLKTRVRKVGKELSGVKLPGQIKEEFRKFVMEIAKKMKGKQYAIRGTASLVLQGIDMGVDDVDVIGDKKAALAFGKLFAGDMTEEVKYSQSNKFKSYYGKFVVDGIPGEIYGDWQIKRKKRWSRVYDARDGQVAEVKVGDIRVRTTSIETELAMYADMGRWNALKKIKRQLENKDQQSLF